MRGKSLRISLLAAVGILFFAPHVFAGTDLYSFPSVDDEKTDRIKKEEPEDDPFIIQLATRTGASEELLTDAAAKGFGRTELIRLILMSKKSEKTLSELMSEREAGKSFKDMAFDLKLDPKAIKKDADSLYKQIAEAMQKSDRPPTPATPAKTKTAGMDDK
jgi:AraC-like DNA-binding protein